MEEPKDVERVEKVHWSGAVVSPDKPDGFPDGKTPGDGAYVLILASPRDGKLYAVRRGLRGMPDLYYSLDLAHMQVPAGSVPAGTAVRRNHADNAMSAFWEFIQDTNQHHPATLFGADWEDRHNKYRDRDRTVQANVTNTEIYDTGAPVSNEFTGDGDPKLTPDAVADAREGAASAVQKPDPDHPTTVERPENWEDMTPAEKGAWTRRHGRPLESE